MKKNIRSVIFKNFSIAFNLDSQIIADESIQDILKDELNIDDEDIQDKGIFYIIIQKLMIRKNR